MITWFLRVACIELGVVREPGLVQVSTYSLSTFKEIVLRK